MSFNISVILKINFILVTIKIIDSGVVFSKISQQIQGNNCQYQILYMRSKIITYMNYRIKHYSSNDNNNNITATE